MREKSKSPSATEFSRFLWLDWKAKVSGSFSAPLPLFVGLVAVAFAIKQDVSPIVYWATAIGAILYSAYGAWVIERNKLIALENEYENREVRRAAINKLWDFRESGIQLRNKHVNIQTS